MRSASIAHGISTSFPKGVRSAFVCVKRSTNAHSKSCHYASSLSTTATATDPTASTCKGKAQSSTDAHYQHLFSLSLPEGQCVGLRLCTDASPPAWISDVLHPKEVAYAMNLPSQTSQDTFFVGRIAMRHALLASHTSSFAALPAVSADDAAILKDEHGRPTMPKGVLGSITHKKKTGVALVSSASTRRRGVGVDLEQTCTGRRSIARRILTEGEILNLGCVEGVTKEEEVLLRFSLKESVYKAMHPLLNQYIGFKEAEIIPHTNGTATVYINLKNGAHASLDCITAHWRRIQVGNAEEEDFFLTSASVSWKDGL